MAVLPGTCTDPNDPDGPLAHLLDALVTYAADALLQQKPQVLMRGYHDFYFSYQIFCSGPPLSKPSAEPNYADMVPRISQQQYPSLDNVLDFLNPKPPPQPTRDTMSGRGSGHLRQ